MLEKRAISLATTGLISPGVGFGPDVRSLSRRLTYQAILKPGSMQ
jgi:hypothetical protein